jgi:hypothetical protein
VHEENVIDPELDAAAATVATLPEPSGPKAWAPAARTPVVTALEAGGLHVVDSPDGAAYAVVSTRLARHRVLEYITLAHEEQLPVVVLVHPGGEALAVEAVRSGGQTAIAEGDVDALRSLGEDDPLQESADRRADALLEAFEASLGRTQAASRAPVTLVDPVSGLPAAGALQLRLALLGADSEAALRMVSISVPALGERTRVRLGTDGHAILHRRVASGMRLLCSGLGELFDSGEGNFLLIAPGLTIEGVERLGGRMAEMVGAYTPDGHVPLSIAVGHAGPECSLDPGTLRELAGRAETAARQEDRSTTLGAGELVKSLATATELEVTMRLAEFATSRSGGPARDGIAQAAVSIANRLGFEGRDRLLVRFCSLVGSMGAALTDQTEQQAAAMVMLVQAMAGPSIASTLGALAEHWDGSGTPNGLAGAAIPTPARIIAVAERLVNDGFAAAGIEAGAGTIYDPTVVQAALEVLAGAGT